MKTKVLRRVIITDLGRMTFPEELLNANQFDLHLKHYLSQGFETVFNTPDNIELTKNDSKGNLMIVYIDTLREA